MGSVGAFAPLGASVFGCNVSYNYAQLCAFPAVAGSFQTRCWREGDGFEPSIVAREPVYIAEVNWGIDGKPKKILRVPMVRIHLPPAASLLRT